MPVVVMLLIRLLPDLLRTMLLITDSSYSCRLFARKCSTCKFPSAKQVNHPLLFETYCTVSDMN
jgi:hypothetical protein